jgi:murein tripeptide amidase MpaA
MSIGSVDVMTSPTSLSKLKYALAGMKQSVMIDNIQTLINQERKHASKYSARQSAYLVAGAPLLAEEIFFDYQDADVYIQYLASLPGTEKISIGKSYLGNDIYGVKFGTGSRHIVAHGGIHAREWISPATTTYIAAKLLGNSSEAVKLRETFTFTYIPVLNIDVYTTN